ncbi:signal peptidase [Chitinispirillum alkaliphilum]|nr:signal peptidase [Chitinispirillum alkaliphilum]
MGTLARILTVIGAITVILILIFVAIGIYTRATRARVPSRTVLEIDFGKGLVEQAPRGLAERIGREERLVIKDLVRALDYASRDDRVKGVVARLDGSPFPYADVQEIRDAVARFRMSGKPAVAYAETFGEAQPGNSSYYLATAFDSVFLQPSGDLNLTGLISQSPFLRRTMEKLDVEPQLGAREEFKTAKNLFTEDGYTEQHREVNQTIIDSVLGSMVRDIARARNIEEGSVRELISQGPYNARQALENGLVDGLKYRDEIFDLMRQRAGDDSRFLYVNRYIQRLRPETRRGRAVALIYAQGTVARGRSRYNPMSGERVMGAQTISAAIRAAVRDNNVGAIVLRINSPGGSYVGSDIIWREISNAREAGIPVIASMGAVAGSGGYFIAMNSDRIIAQPSTITGSIGVVAGKFDARGLYNKFGITFDDVTTDPNATIWSLVHQYTDEQWEQIQSWLDNIYDDFVSKVAAGRDMERERVLEIARGRIYTGTEALEIGLVDSIGGFPLAINEAKRFMDIPEEEPVRIKIFPKRRTLWEQLTARPPESSEDVNCVRHYDIPVTSLKQFMRTMQKLGIFSQRGILSMEEPTLY